MMKRYKKKILYFLWSMIMLGFGWTIYIQWLIFSVPQHSPEKSDVGIVLGAALWNDYPSPALQERLDAAYDLYTKGYYENMIVSGGIDGNGATITEAEGMKRYLVAKGVAADHIFLENQSQSTYENLFFSKKLMENYHWNRSIIVTHEYHGARAWDIARFLGFNDSKIHTIASRVLWMPWHKGRETLAFSNWLLQKYLLF